jgi:hypothetical protein
MTNSIIQNIKNFYDTSVFFAILGSGIFLLLWDYPIFKTKKEKNDARITLVMGILCLMMPFVFYAVSKL